MKVLLIQPPIEDFYDTSIRTYPLSLIYLATKIKDCCDVSVADFRTGRKRMLKDHPFPDLAPFYRKDTETPFSLFRAYQRFGFDLKEIKEYIAREKPHVVGISSLFTTYAEEAIETAGAVKEVDPAITTIMGGTHPTLFPDDCLASPSVDFVIRGEGEMPLLRLIERLKAGQRGPMADIPGVCFRDASGAHISPIATEEDIDEVPDRTCIDSSRYRIGRKKYAVMLTTRGCPFACSFCGKPPVPYRKRSITAIEKEIRQCIDLGIEAIDFEDDMLNLDLPFFHALLERFKGTGVVLSAMNGLYAGNLDNLTLDRMFDAGFRRLNFSLVDSSETVHHSQQRRFPTHFKDLLDYLKTTSFLVEAHFIIGLPKQKPDDIIDTMVFLMARRLLLGPSMYYLAPGSTLFNAHYDTNPQKNIKIMRSSVIFPSNPLFQREKLYTFMKLARFINLIKGLIDTNQDIEYLSDILKAEAILKRPRDAFIIRELLSNKRFIWRHSGLNDYIEEPQDKDLVAHFFKIIKGKTITGFKTAHSLIVDV